MYRILELITDPSSGSLSMSRLCLGVIILVYLPFYYMVLPFLSITMEIPDQIIITTIAALSGIYGLNSVAGAVTSTYNKFCSKDKKRKKDNDDENNIENINIDIENTNIPTPKANEGD